jgi:hypothetical protein
VFLQCSCPRVTLVPRTVRCKGPDGPCVGVFSKKLLLSGIIYSIPDSRVRMVVDDLMHLWNDQLGKLVSLEGLWWSSSTKIDYRKYWNYFTFRMQSQYSGTFPDQQCLASTKTCCQTPQTSRQYLWHFSSSDINLNLHRFLMCTTKTMKMVLYKESWKYNGYLEGLKWFEHDRLLIKQRARLRSSIKKVICLKCPMLI